LEAQIPVSNNGNGAYYIEIKHRQGGFPLASVPGYSLTESYTLEANYVPVDPDGGDLTTPDNSFETEPYLHDSAGDFGPTYRDLGGPPTNNTNTPRVGAGASFVDVASNGAFTAASGCQDISLTGYDEFGVTAALNITSLTASAGTVFNSCAGAIVAVKADWDTGTVGYSAAAGADVTFTIDGDATTIDHAADAFTLNHANSGNPTQTGVRNRGIAVGAKSPEFRVTATGATGPLVNLTTAGATVLCASTNAAPTVCATAGGSCPATGAGSANCTIPLGAGFVLKAAAPGKVTLTATDNGTTLSRDFFLAAYTPASLDIEFVTDAGFISYAGDNDFFDFDVSNFPAEANMTVEAIMPSSDVDLRIIASRGGEGASAGAFVPSGTFNDNAIKQLDLCTGGGQCSDLGGTCNTTRNFCDGSQALTYANSGTGPLSNRADCVYMINGGNSLQVWVNDIDMNDWDTTNGYRFRIRMREGCPAECGYCGF